MSRAWRVVSSLYVVTVVVLAGPPFAPPWSVLLLCLPAAVPALPVVYVVGATVWNVTGADSGGPMWVVQLVYMLMFAGIATANVLVVRILVTAVRRWRAARPSGPAAHANPVRKGL